MFNLPLSGVRVLDLSRLVPGPFCTLLLAQMGAEVIKIESPLAGDYLRLAPPDLGFEAAFDRLNQAKLSVALNFRAPRCRAIMTRLVQDVDVIVETFRPGAMPRWGLGYEALRAIHPRLVYCSLSGYGQSGPYRNRAGHDLNYITVGGLLSLNRVESEPPQIPPVPIADLAGGMLAALAIASALFSRERTGVGTYLDVSLLDPVLLWVAPLAAAALARSDESTREPLGGALPCYNLYATADGRHLTLAALEPHFWSNFCQTVNRAEWLARQFDPSLRQELAQLFQTRPCADWLRLFENVEACLEPVPSLKEMQQHPQVQHRNRDLGLSDGKAGSAMGAHTRLVLKRIGLSEDELAELEAEGLIKTEGERRR